MLYTKQWGVFRSYQAKKFLSAQFASVSGEGVYQFIENSMLKTMHFQPSLPRLPIPKLEDTCRRYVEGVTPILSESQLRATKSLVTEFSQHEGKDLHQQLVDFDKANKQTSYISAPWSDMYLRGRIPVAINHNPFMAMQLDPMPAYNDQLIRATNLVISILRFKRSLDERVLSPEVFELVPAKSNKDRFESILRFVPTPVAFYVAAGLFKTIPLCMNQYPLMFGTTRIPHHEHDTLYQDTGSRHLLVIRRGHMYTVEVLDANGSIRSPAEIQAALGHVLAQTEVEDQSISVLTTLERDVWADARDKLIEAGNEESLRKIESALFCLCLDDEAYQTDNHDDAVPIIKSLLHGNGNNRYFDKSLSVIVQSNGLTAVNFEHSWGDGVAVLRLFEDVFKDSQKHWATPGADINSDAACVGRVDMKHTPGTKAAINAASKTFQDWTSRLSFDASEYTNMNRDYIKSRKVSPDALMQMAIQVAYFRMFNGRTPSTYESCSTAVYRHGRTETMRPATRATKTLVNEMHGKMRDNLVALRGLMGEASKLHFQLCKEASMGQGFDRHLFALKYFAEKQGRTDLPLFADEGYRDACHFHVSTSTLSTDTLSLGGFGPVVPDGFGVGYNVGSQRLGAVVSSYKDAGNNSTEFVQAFKEALDDLKKILDAGQS